MRRHIPVTEEWSLDLTLTPDQLAETIRSIPDFPNPGILFRDITTLLKNPEAFRSAVDLMAAPFVGRHIDVVVGVESRGFVVATPIAYHIGAGFVLVRKPGKLPAATIRAEYSLEYGTNVLEMHVDAIRPGQRVLIVDDLLATGGTVNATIQLVERLGGVVAGISFLVELRDLKGRDVLVGYPNVHSIIKY
jgi:adenine phosphoribosyltransferase